jgi:tripartite-type tricarboxylate transporter receptor subunit TctC
MTTRLSRRRVLAGIGAFSTGVGAVVPAARATDFYRGKTLTVIIGFAPGGGVDTTARMVARHLVRFIPGQPSLVIQNMEGAGGLVAANHLGRRASPDGLTLAVPGRSWFVEGIVKNPGASFDPTQFAFIGSPGAVNSMVWVRAGTGIKSFDDLKAHPKAVSFGSLGIGTPTGMIPAMLAGQGLPIKLIFGYVSTARVLLALEQGEIDAAFTVEDSFARRQDLIKKGVVLPVLQNKPTLPDIPLIRDVLPAKDLPLLTLVLALENFGLPLVGPPGIPPDRIDALRQAFMAMCDDKDYRAEAARIEQPIGAPLEGGQLQTMINDLAAEATPDIVAAYRRLSASKP